MPLLNDDVDHNLLFADEDFWYLPDEDATARAESDPRYVPTRDSGAAELAILDEQLDSLADGAAN